MALVATPEESPRDKKGHAMQDTRAKNARKALESVKLFARSLTHSDKPLTVEQLKALREVVDIMRDDLVMIGELIENTLYEVHSS